MPDESTESQEIYHSEDIEIKELQKSLELIFKTTDPVHKNYLLMQAAKKHNMPLDFFCRTFEIYSLKQSEIELLKFKWISPIIKLKNDIEPLTRFLVSLSSLSVFIGLITFISEIPQRNAQKEAQIQNSNYQAWQVIIASNNAHEQASGGRIDALQNLNKNKQNLYGLEIKNARLDEIKLPYAKLYFANFNTVSLAYSNFKAANFYMAQMRGNQFSSSNLQRTKFLYADLSDSSFEKADLENADLSYANLSNTNLSSANLKNVIWKNALYDKDTKFPINFNPKENQMILLAPSVNLRNFRLVNFDLSHLQLTKANLTKANLNNANLEDTDMTSSNLSGANLTDTNLTKSNLSGVNLSNTIIRRTILKNAILKDANLKNADICNVDIKPTDLTLQQLKEAQFCGKK